MSDLTPKLPLSFGDKPGYLNIDNISDLVKQNLKNLCLTSPGERLMDSNFGVGIRNFLFRQSVASAFGEISARIQSQVSNYMPFVEIEEVAIVPDEVDNSIIYVSILYFVTPTSEEDILNLTIRQ